MAKSKQVYRNNIKVPKGQMTFLHLFEPDNGQFGQGKYAATIIFPKGTDLKPLKRMCLEMAREKWGGQIKKLSQIQTPFRDGDDKAEKYPYFAGKTYLRARTNNKPNVVGPDRRPVEKGDMYWGVIGRLVVTAGTYEASETVRTPEGKKVTEKIRGVAFFLEIVQKLGDGDRLAGGGADVNVLDDDESLEALEDDADNPDNYSGGGDDDDNEGLEDDLEDFDDDGEEEDEEEELF